MDRHPSHYNTVRILAPVVPFYDHATAAAHHRHIAGGPGPGPGPGGGPPGMYAQPILVSHHHHHNQPAYQLYHARAFSTVNPAKLTKSAVIYQQQQQQQVSESRGQHVSSLNTWFTWKRKSKNTNTAVVAQNGTAHLCASSGTHHQHMSEYCPSAGSPGQSTVPPSLARLFVQPNGRPASVKVANTSTTSKSMCICSGLTQSTFMAPSYFDDDDQHESSDQRRKSIDENNAKLGKCKSKSKTLRAIKASKSSRVTESSGTLRAISTGSLLMGETSPITRPFNTLNMNRLNQAKSCDQLHSTNRACSEESAQNRKSILECDVNPYELVEPPGKKRGAKESSKSKVKCATVAAKSSRRSQSQGKTISSGIEYDSIECVEGSGEMALHRNGHGRTPLHKGIFNPANSIRIAGQSVYSSIKFGTDELMIEEKQTTTTTITTIQSKFKSSIDVNQQHQSNNQSSMHRSKSTASLDDWSFDSTASNPQPQPSSTVTAQPESIPSLSPKLSNFHSVLIEPEPDYDMDEDMIEEVSVTDTRQIATRSTDSLSVGSMECKQLSSSRACHKSHSCSRRARSSSITRPKVNPPPPPEPSSIPPPPPPPPPNFFANVSTSPIDSISVSSMSLCSSLSSLKPSSKSNSTSSRPVQSDPLSFQNELKEKLNRGVKSILKKTNAPVENRVPSNVDSDSSANENADSLESTDSCGSVENRIQAFESSSSSPEIGNSRDTLPKPKKHVHFRVKSRNGHLSRSRSTSHIITETIQEEEDEHGFYDDVAIPLSQTHNVTRSFDDISIVSISSCSSIANSTPLRKQSHSPTLDIEDKPQRHYRPNRSTPTSTGNASNKSDSLIAPQHHTPQPHQSDLFVDNLAHFDERSHLNGRKNETTTDTDGVGGNRGDTIGRTSLPLAITQPFEHSNGNVSNRTASLGNLLPQSGSYDDRNGEEESGHQQSTRSKHGSRRTPSKLSSQHRFDTNSSPTPPPIPARRILSVTTSSMKDSPTDKMEQPNNQNNSSKKSSLSRAVRSYSSGSVRSLLARKLNRTISGNSARLSQSNGSKLALSNLFSAKPEQNNDNSPMTSSEFEQRVVHVNHSKNGHHTDQVDEHIYEELDSLFMDASAQTTPSPQSAHHSTSSSSSFFGARISRAEILDYLQDARGRLAEQEKVVHHVNKNDHDNEQGRDEDSQDLCEVSLSVVSAVNPSDLTDLNDSGNSSFVDAIDYSDAFVPGYGKSRVRKNRTRNNSADQNISKQASNTASNTSSVVNRRNRVSNVSNSSSDSSATSGVSGISSNLSDDIEEDDMITNSSSSLGSMANENGSAGSASCYYGTCGSIGSGAGGASSTVLERNDSGVGAEISGPKCLLSKAKSASTSEVQSSDYDSRPSCIDCDLESMENSLGDGNNKTPSFHNSFSSFHSHICLRCEKRRNERKEIISEIVDTELKYGRDLKIIQEEFARPISVAGLMTSQQVDDIFLNLDELIEVNEHFAEQLQDALDCAFDQDDEDLTTLSIGQLFHDCLLARISVFEQYCIRQGSGSLLLNQLEKEKDLLRVFLRVSQMENTLLRRMNLRSFLVVPVQRVTKYPLLLNRLHKVTSHHHPDRESLRDAQVKLEFHLESINQKTRGSIAATTSRIWRRISNLSSASIRSKVAPNETYMDDFGYVRLKKTALDLLKWPKDESRFALIGKLSYIVEKAGTSSEQINLTSSYNQNSGSVSIFNLSSSTASASNTTSSSSFWSRTLKFSTANAILVTLSPSTTDSDNLSPSEPNSLTLYEQMNYSDGLNSGAQEQLTESNRFNSSSRRANSKSPSRVSSSAAQQKSPNPIREAVLLLFKEKNGRYVLCRDILRLSMCVIANATEADSEEFFEIHELESRESLLLKAETHSEMKEWLEQLRHHASGLGNWRRRRNALPNIMVLRSVVDQQF